MLVAVVYSFTETLSIVISVTPPTLAKLKVPVVPSFKTYIVCVPTNVGRLYDVPPLNCAFSCPLFISTISKVIFTNLFCVEV